eukprot:scaffold5406_cov129-Isochrysis_galbana.AAC.3
MTRHDRQPPSSAWNSRAKAALPMVSSDHASSSTRDGATPRSIRYRALAAASSTAYPAASRGGGRCVVPRDRTRYQSASPSCRNAASSRSATHADGRPASSSPPPGMMSASYGRCSPA